MEDNRSLYRFDSFLKSKKLINPEKVIPLKCPSNLILAFPVDFKEFKTFKEQIQNQNKDKTQSINETLHDENSEEEPKNDNNLGMISRIIKKKHLEKKQ
jgi:hypothetical protein